MSTAERTIALPRGIRLRVDPTLALGLLAFVVLFWSPIETLVDDWLNDPDAGHGLLLVPIAGWLTWRLGVRRNATPSRIAGTVMLAGAIAFRYMAGLAAELFTMRLSLLMAVAALVIFAWGVRQVLRWWLPFTLVLLSVPVPDVIINTLAFPLQLLASKWGAALLAWREVPVALAGNVIHLPGQALFVTEACSGLRSLTALIALGLLTGGALLRSPWTRLLLLAVAIPVAVMLNAVRIFVTGYLVYFIDPALGDGVMHYTEGWAIFLVALVILGVFALILSELERGGPREAAA